MGLEDSIQERTIDGVTYRVTPLGLGIGKKTLSRFLQIVSGVMAPMLENKSSMESAGAAALKTLPTLLTDAEVTYFQSVFGPSSAYRDGDKWVPLLEATQEVHFAGRYMALFDWLAFCVEVNFAPFLRELIARGSGALSAESKMGQLLKGQR